VMYHSAKVGIYLLILTLLHQHVCITESELRECDDPGVPENGRRFGDDLSIGSTIYFQCFDGYELIGERFITCQQGALWTSNGPFCRAKVGKNGRRNIVFGLYMAQQLSPK